MFLTANLDVYKQAKRTKRQTDKQTNTRSSLESGGRSSPAAESPVFAKREKNLRTEKAFDSLASCFVLRVDRLLVFLHSRVRPRVRHESNRNRSGFADEVRNLPNERTNERTNEYCAKRRRLKSTRPQSKSLR